MDRRAVVTLCHVLRRHAEDQLRTHGVGANRPGSHVMTPNEMDELADAIEDGRAELVITDLTDEDLLS